MIGGVPVFTGRRGVSRSAFPCNDAARPSVFESRRLHGVFRVVTAFLPRKDSFIVAEDGAVLGIREGAARFDERQRCLSFAGQVGRGDGGFGPDKRKSVGGLRDDGGCDAA